MSMKSDRTISIWVISVVAIIFGLLTIKSGGSVIFIDGPDRLAAGNYVTFVVWFNFLAGFSISLREQVSGYKKSGLRSY